MNCVRCKCLILQINPTFYSVFLAVIFWQQGSYANSYHCVLTVYSQKLTFPRNSLTSYTVHWYLLTTWKWWCAGWLFSYLTTPLITKMMGVVLPKQQDWQSGGSWAHLLRERKPCNAPPVGPHSAIFQAVWFVINLRIFFDLSFSIWERQFVKKENALHDIYCTYIAAGKRKRGVKIRLFFFEWTRNHLCRSTVVTRRSMYYFVIIKS